MWGLIEECWYDNPSARLTSLRIKKNLTHMYEQHLLREQKNEEEKEEKKVEEEVEEVEEGD